MATITVSSSDDDKLEVNKLLGEIKVASLPDRPSQAEMLKRGLTMLLDDIKDKEKS
jgi:hypothetical protein